MKASGVPCGTTVQCHVCSMTCLLGGQSCWGGYVGEAGGGGGDEEPRGPKTASGGTVQAHGIRLGSAASLTVRGNETAGAL